MGHDVVLDGPCGFFSPSCYVILWSLHPEPQGVDALRLGTTTTPCSTVLRIASVRFGETSSCSFDLSHLTAALHPHRTSTPPTGALGGFPIPCPLPKHMPNGAVPTPATPSRPPRISPTMISTTRPGTLRYLGTLSTTPDVAMNS